MSTSNDNPFDPNNNRIQFQNTAMVLFWKYNTTQRGIPLYNPITDCNNQFQINSTVAYETIKSNDQTSLLKTFTTTVFSLSRPPMAPLNIADIYSLSSTNNNPLQTNLNLNATANPSQTLYQPPTVPNRGFSASLPTLVLALNPMTLPLYLHKFIQYLLLQ